MLAGGTVLVVLGVTVIVGVASSSVIIWKVYATSRPQAVLRLRIMMVTHISDNTSNVVRLESPAPESSS